MYDVALYGHITLDRIFNNFRKDQAIGSIGNVWKHLNMLNPSLNLYVEPTDIGEALIFINQRTNERASVANLSLFNKEPTIEESSWSHVMYLNELKSVDFISGITSPIISADICRGRALSDLEILKKIDFLFLSDEDVFAKPREILAFLKKGLILHKPSGSTYYGKDGSIIENSAEMVHDVNVLGCGDMLAAGFINYHLLKNDLKKSLQKSHEQVTRVLVNQKGKINGDT